MVWKLQTLMLPLELIERPLSSKSKYDEERDIIDAN